MSTGDPGGRRQFLRRSSLVLGSLSGLAEVQALCPPEARAQTGQPERTISFLTEPFIEAFTDPANIVSHHAYSFEYAGIVESLTSTPLALLPTTYIARPSTDQIFPLPPAERYLPLVQPAPFANLAIPESSPYPPLALLGGVAATYRYLLRINPDKIRVFDWCTVSSPFGSEIVITTGTEALAYLVRTPIVGGQPPPIPVNILDRSPRLDYYWDGVRDRSAVGGSYFATNNTERVAASSAVWTAVLYVVNGQELRIDAYVPGVANPQTRTARASYEIATATGVQKVLISQQRRTSEWVNLGTFRFQPGTFTVKLTDVTGEVEATRVVVANALRWHNA